MLKIFQQCPLTCEYLWQVSLKSIHQVEISHHVE